MARLPTLFRLDRRVQSRSPLEHSAGAPAPAVGYLRRYVPMSVLAVAGLLKLEYLAFSAPERHNWAVALIVIELSLALGLVWADGKMRLVVESSATLVFAFFILASAYRVGTGARGCDCFGRVEVAPQYALLMCAVSFAILAPRCFPTGLAVDGRRHEHYIAPSLLKRAVVLLCLILPAGLLGRTVHNYRALRLEEVNPARWVGTRCPLVDESTIGGQLGNGRWYVVLYNASCPRCAREVDQYLSSPTPGAERHKNLAMINVGPDIADSKEIPRGVISGRVDGPGGTLLLSAIRLALEDGIVSTWDNLR